jgi:magnesium chelatase family protein
MPIRLHWRTVKPCSCSPTTITRYQKRISGLLLDRVDIHLEVPHIDYKKLVDRGRPSRQPPDPADAPLR